MHFRGYPAPIFISLRPCYFSFFLNRKKSSKHDIQKRVTDMLETIPVEEFQRYYQKWEQRLYRCVPVLENYYEKNKNFGS